MGTRLVHLTSTFKFKYILKYIQKIIFSYFSFDLSCFHSQIWLISREREFCRRLQACLKIFLENNKEQFNLWSLGIREANSCRKLISFETLQANALAVSKSYIKSYKLWARCCSQRKLAYTQKSSTHVIQFLSQNETIQYSIQYFEEELVYTIFSSNYLAKMFVQIMENGN